MLKRVSYQNIVKHKSQNLLTKTTDGNIKKTLAWAMWTRMISCDSEWYVDPDSQVAPIMLLI